MKKAISVLLFLTVLVQVFPQSVSFKTYMNPVIPGDHPDCTLTKIGNDYYTTGSSFNVTPVIYHSTDLVHWEAIAQPVSGAWSGFGDKAGGGCWGGQMVLYNGEYWHYFSRGNVMHFTKADKPEGPWSLPTRVNNPPQLPYSLGYDNSLFIDDDNKWYLVVKNGKPNGGIVELGNNGQPTGVVYNLNWLNPGPEFPYSWAEGPVMWKYKGYYYYSFAHDLSGGQKVMRSKTLTADKAAWEMLGAFFNESDPKKYTSLFTAPNHASQVVMLDDSTSWIVHPIYAKGEWKGQGRQGLMNQVRYNEADKPTADYPINSHFATPELPSSGIPWMVPKSDYFTDEVLRPEWCFLGYTYRFRWSLTDRPGWLRLTPKSSTKGNTLLKNDGEHNYSLITRVDFQPTSTSDEAGLWIMRGDETMHIKLVSTKDETGNNTIAFSFKDKKFETANSAGDTVWLKMVRVNHIITGYLSENNSDWIEVGEGIDISEIDGFSDFSTFTGSRQGLYVAGKKEAFFDMYIYRDAYTPILAECPANQFGTQKGNVTHGIRPLDNIDHGDWALYAGVEFGDGTSMPDSVEIIASSIKAEGVVEIWLDSLDTGTKISECMIHSTGRYSTFKAFKAKVENVSGRHDVYLKFKGSSGRLYMIQWITFLKNEKISTNIAALKNSDSPLSVYPNPANDFIQINAGIPFHTIEVFHLNGQLAYKEKVDYSSHPIALSQSIKSGIYILKVSNKNECTTTTFKVEKH